MGIVLKSYKMRKILSLAVMLLCFVYSGYAIKVNRTVFPNEIKSGGEIVVSVEVTKEGAEGFAKLMETIPAGFKAVEFNSVTGNFIYENGKLRIIWLTMPEGETYKAEYKLVHDGSNHGAMSINGKFYYVENDKRAEVLIPAASFTVFKPVEKKELVAAQPLPKLPTVEKVNTDTAVNSVATDLVVEEKVNEVEEKAAEIVDVVVEEKKEVIAEVKQPKGSGLIFKIQLGAYSSEKPNSLFGTLPDIHFVKTGKVYKYYSGKFTNEADARAVIPQAKAQGFTGAFLVRFKDGKRI